MSTVDAPSPRTHTAARAAANALQLYTPAAAAQLLAVPQSWLQRKAAARLIPCTFLGKHLRFSHTDLTAIIAAGTRPAITGHGQSRTRPRRG